MAKYTIEEIINFREMGILTDADAAELINAIVSSEKNNCSSAGAATYGPTATHELKYLVDKYGLPLKVKMPRFYGDFYFLAERIDEHRHMIDGSQFCNGKYYRSKSYSYSEACSLLEPATIARKATSDSDLQSTFEDHAKTSDNKENSVKNSESIEFDKAECHRGALHWFDRYIKGFKEYCHEFGFDSDDCDSNCRWCDVLHDYMVDDIGVHDGIWPYNFASQEEYAAACAFANEADEIVSDEEARWWSGDPGYIQGISSTAIDPHDFCSMEQYKEALYHHLFEEAVIRHPIIPHTDCWFHTYVRLLKDSESVFCADKSILALLDEVNYDDAIQDVAQHISDDDELNREIRYSSWKEPRNPPRYSSGYSEWRPSSYFYPHLTSQKKEVQRYRKKYTETQFRNDLYYHYPELFTLINGILHPPGTRMNTTQPQTDKSIKEHLDDILISAFYLHDLYNFSIEDSIQNGLVGLIAGLKNGFWEQQSPSYWKREDYLENEIHVNIIQYSQEIANHFGFTIDRKLAKVLESIIYGRSTIHSLSVYDLCNDYRVTDRERYIMYKIEAFFAGKNQLVSIEIPECKDDTAISFLTEDELTSDPADATFRTILAKEMKEILDTLTGTERYVLQMRFGMYDGSTYTLEEIGQILEVTRERIRQIENKAIRKIRHPSRAKKIKDFYS